MPDFELPLWRLHLLRAMYLLIAVGLGLTFGPAMLSHDSAWALRKGETAALLSGLALLSLLGLRYPLRMLPLLLFELAWKLIWLLLIALPLVQAGELTPAVQEGLLACGMGVVLVPLVIPWRHVMARYLRAPAERWR